MDITPIIDKYIIADKIEREEIEKYIRARENWKLSLQCVGIMRSAATESVRQKSKDILIQGLYGNVLEGARADPRDNLTDLVLLYHSAILIGLNPDEEFKIVANDTKGNGKDLIVSFINQEAKAKTLKCVGYRTTKTPQFDYVFDGANMQYIFGTEYLEETDKKIMNISNTTH